MKSPLTIIFITVFVDLLGFGMIIPVLPYYAQTFGASFFMVGLLTMSYSLMHFVFAPMWGRLSDRYGRRPILLISLAGSALALLIFGLADSLFWLFAARLLDGAISSASIPTAQAYIADSTTPENRSKGMGLIGAAFGLGFIFGPAMGGILSQYGYPVPAFVAAGIAGVNFFWAVVKLPETLTKPRTSSLKDYYYSPSAIKDTLHTKALVFLITVNFVMIYAFSAMESTFALFCEHRAGLDAIHVGGLLAEIGVISVIIQGGLIGRLTKRFGEVKLTHWGLFFMGIGLLATTALDDLFGLILVMPLYAVGSSLTHPSLTSLVSQAADDDKQGATMGIMQGFSALGRVLGPPSGTGLFQWITPASPFAFGGILLIATMTATLLRLRKLIHPTAID